MKVFYYSFEQGYGRRHSFFNGALAADPIGLFALKIDHRERIGHMIAGLGPPLPLIQEGDYHFPSLGGLRP